MKKRIMLAYLLAAAIFAVGCGNEESVLDDESVNSTEDVIVAGEFETQVLETEAVEQLAEDNVSGRITYPGELFVWEEVSVTIPQAWNDKYIVKEDANGVSFYQTASNKKEDTMGFLLGIYRSDRYSNAGIGETLVAYTDEGVLYYVIQPTDMTCYMEDETILNEYNEMMRYVEWIAGNMEIAAENVHYDANQYKLPVSSILPLESYQLSDLSNNELWVARNEIYARHGKIFQNEYLASYFEACSWYEAKEDKAEVSERELNEVETANLKLIIAAEKAYELEHPYPKQYVAGEETKASLHGSKEIQRICYEVVTGENSESKCTLTIDGNVYDLDEYVTMTAPVEDVFYLTDIAYYDEKLEIAVLDNGASDDPVTYFFQYDGILHYVGEVQGFPFDDYGNNFFDGFSGQNLVIGTKQVDIMGSSFVYSYYWYNVTDGTLKEMENISLDYTWYNGHELYKDMPVYYSPDEKSPLLTMQAGEEIYFISTDGREWILIRSADGKEGYIHVKGGQVLNIGLPGEEVFSELYYFG